MKNLFFTVILWGGIFMSFVNAQVINEEYEWSDLNGEELGVASVLFPELVLTRAGIDTLRIFAQNKLIMKVTCPRIQTLRKGTQMAELLKAFRDNLVSIQSQIPEYSIYQINYLKDASLIVEEVEGIVQYEVNNGIASLGYNQSVAHLRDKNLVISIYFNEINDLSDKTYDKMLGSAFAEMPRPPSRIKENWNPIQVYNFSVSQSEMIKRRRSPRGSRRYTPVIPVILSGGTFKNQLIYEVGGGFGFYVGRRKQNYVYSFTTVNYTYDNELDKSKFQELIGLAFSTPRLGLSVAFPANLDTEDVIYDDVACRIGFSSRAYKNISVNLHQYIEKKFRDLHWGMSIGIAF